MNIFYSQVDDAVQRELNARGNSGKNRTTENINFMVGKIANVQVTAYKSGSADPSMQYPGEYGVLGGKTVLGPRFQPSGEGGFLTNPEYTVDTIKFDDFGNASLDKKSFTDNSRRIGPIVTSVSVDIGDHSMGLLNKATINITIPNPTRDLDKVEEVWFYPGRYVKIDIVYPDSAIITGTENLLSTSSLFGSLPEEIVNDKLKKLYPSLSNSLNEFKRRIRKLNEFSFQGLITSFDFSYTEDGSVNATISLTGTSNTYTDVTMLMNPATKKTNEKKSAVYDTIEPVPVAELQERGIETNNGSTEFYGMLYNQFEKLRTDFKNKNLINEDFPILIPFTTDKSTSQVSDRFILYGEIYPSSTYDFFAQNAQTTQNANTAIGPVIGPAAAPEAPIAGPITQNEFEQQQSREQSAVNSRLRMYTQTQRYITLGALIGFINEYIIQKIKGAAVEAEITCTDTTQFSNYYPALTSCIPKDILLLPNKNNLQSNAGGMNIYGNLVLYPNILQTMSGYKTRQWEGISSADSDNKKIFPSRIFINLEYIQQVLNELSNRNTRAFTVSSFLANISNRIAYATGNAIILKLVTDSTLSTTLLFADAKFLKPIDTTKRVTKYSVPMLANHPSGSVVHGFTFQAKLPSNVKNLSYVLNSGTDVSDEEIAPYLNFMYNSKDPETINKARDKYKQKHEQIINNLNDAKTAYGNIPFVDEQTTKLSKALFEYIKFPFPDITKAQQLTAPIFPFDVDFTIDGINGLRYGDVLTFEGLPEKYRQNTVFSIIGITHDVDTAGVWTTKVKCIMRPEIG